MSRKIPEKVSPREQQRLFDNFWTMIALLESKEEVRNFFKDLLSATESLMLARRIEIASLLLRGESYDEITKQLGAANSTVASVHRWLQGGFGGYKKVLPKLEKELTRRRKTAEKREQAREPFSKEWMKKRYPLHFLLCNLFDENLTPPKKLRK